MLHTDKMILLSLTVLSLLFSLSAIVVAERISYYTFESVEAGESLTLCKKYIVLSLEWMTSKMFL